MSENDTSDALTYSKSVTAKTEALKSYLQDINGEFTLAGQEYKTANQPEIQYIYSKTGKLPAIMGYDLAETQLVQTSYTTVEDAIKWGTESNGIVTLMWHWNVPIDVNDLSKGYSNKSKRDYSDGTDFSLKNAVTEGTAEYDFVIQSIDNIAFQLKKLEAAGVPVLWRPMHEASGASFWYGVGDYNEGLGYQSAARANYKALWSILYDRLENHHKLKNLIWVWNGQSRDYMPDASTFDIASYDYGSMENGGLATYNNLKGWTNNDKMVALSEVEAIPDIDDMVANNVRWLYWVTWYQHTVFNIQNGQLVAGATTDEVLIKNYTSDYVITLDELPLLNSDNTREVPEIIKELEREGNISGTDSQWENDQITLEFEFGTMDNCSFRVIDGCSGIGVADWYGNTEGINTYVTVDVPVGKAGAYTAEIFYIGAYNSVKDNSLIVNGEATELLRFNMNPREIQSKTVEIILTEGENTIGFFGGVSGNGYVYFDCLKLTKN